MILAEEGVDYGVEKIISDMTTKKSIRWFVFLLLKKLECMGMVCTCICFIVDILSRRLVWIYCRNGQRWRETAILR